MASLAEGRIGTAVAVWLERLGWRTALLAVFAVLVLVWSGAELVESVFEGQPWQNTIDELLLMVIGSALIVSVVREAGAVRVELSQLRERLASAGGGVAGGDTEARAAARHYRESVEAHFARWQLTPAEQEVAIGLLKGLSLNEIAALRDTREKTVRQQASSLYRKSGLAGRHELAAWFFEDLLDRG